MIDKREKCLPPQLAEFILSRILNKNERVILLGDFSEFYKEISRTSGPRKAFFWYWFQVLKSLPHFIGNVIYWRAVMFSNYVKITLRNIKKHKAFSFINIIGLALGMACCMLLVLWIQDEITYDRFHENKDDIYRVISFWERNNWQGLELTPAPLATAIKEKIPEIRYTARVIAQSRSVFKYQDKVFYEDGGIIADPSLFKIFTFPFIHGNSDEAFKNPEDIVVTESFATKYFGNENPIGKTIQKEEKFVTVKGVIKDVPRKSHIQFDFIQSFEFVREYTNFGTMWGAFNFNTYVLLHKNRILEDIGKKMTDIASQNDCYHVKKGLYFRLQPLSQVHLDGREYKTKFVALGDKRLVTMFSLIAAFVLVIACVNFMNLSTARSIIRSREVGLRKTVGANRSMIIKQFFGESILLTIISAVFALIIVFLALPYFNHISGKQLVLNFTDLQFDLFIFSILLITGILSGSYPAIVLSSYHPVQVLKNVDISSKKGNRFRKLLVVFQFTLAILLIIGTTVIYKQLHFIRNKKLGIETANVIFIPIKENIAKKYDIVKNELLQNPDILSVSATWNHFYTTTWRNAGFNWEGREKDRDKKLDLIFTAVDYNFFETLNIELISGRNFSIDKTMDKEGSYILNEAAVQEMGMKNPIGKWFEISPNYKGAIIGIAKDVHFRSLQKKIEPRIYFISDMHNATAEGIVLIKFKNSRTTQTLAAIEHTWEEFNKISPFEYHFLDESYESLYQNERKIGTVLNYFTGLVIFISCLGLFGLSSFMTERRVKEIGIRKVLGANVSEIVILLSKDFVRWILVANVLAWPIGYFVMTKILQNYAYRITLGFDIFALSGLLAILIAVLTISYQSIKTACLNPVESLRYE